MGNLIVSIIAAFALAISVYNETASLLLAFLTYSLAGTMFLGTAILADAFGHGDENQFNTTE